MNPRSPDAHRGPGRPARGKPLSCAELVEELCAASIALREARRLHLAAYGTLIPHVFMAAVLARLGDCFVLGAAHAMDANGPEIKGMLAALEEGMAHGDREARNVVAISFVRDAEVEIFFQDLRPLLGPVTRAQLHGG